MGKSRGVEKRIVRRILGRLLEGEVNRFEVATRDLLVLIGVTTHHHLWLSAYLGNLTGNYCRFSNQIKHLWQGIVP